jgi:hypothetical protein
MINEPIEPSCAQRSKALAQAARDRIFLVLTDFVVTVSSLPMRKQSTGYATSLRDKQSH